MGRVLTLWGRPDGKKKAYVRLTPDHDALDVANKVGDFCLCVCGVFNGVVDWFHLSSTMRFRCVFSMSIHKYMYLTCIHRL